MSNKQKEILKLFSPKSLIFSKKVVVTVCGSGYHCSADKYIGKILSRMARNGLPVRVRTDFFKPGPGLSSVKKKEADKK